MAQFATKLTAHLSAKGSLVAGTLAAIGASLCCVGPLVLLALGIGGVWVGGLTAMAPYRPALIGLTLLFLALAFRKLYLVQQVCEAGTPCADPRRIKRQRFAFWVVVVLLLGLLAVPFHGQEVAAEGAGRERRQDRF